MRPFDRQPYAKLIQALDILTVQLYGTAQNSGMMQNRTRSEYRYLAILRSCHMIVRGSIRGQWSLQDDVLTPSITDHNLIQIAALIGRLNHDHPLLYLGRLHDTTSRLVSDGFVRPAEINPSMAYMIDIIETAIATHKPLRLLSTSGQPTRIWPIDLVVDQTNKAISLCSARKTRRGRHWFLTRHRLEFPVSLAVEDGDMPQTLPDTHRLDYLRGLNKARQKNYKQQQHFLSLRDKRIALLLMRLNAYRIS